MIILRNPIAGTATATAAGQVDAASKGALVSVSIVVFAEVNKKKGADLIVFKSHDVTSDKDSRRSRCLCCC